MRAGTKEWRRVDESFLRLKAALASRYALSEAIGSGGMATVYLADDVRHHRKVGVKVLRPELAAALGDARFLREIEIAARLAHPHILPLFDSGVAGGFLYYVGPYVEEGSLRRRLEQSGRLPLSDALRTVREVGAALDYAHRQGYVHRDVKPENILFTDGHAVLADFGIARALCTATTDALTDPGVVLGTPEYMSPEQAAGEQDPGVETDIYSLACVVYEMLAGEPPLRGRNARATMAKHVTEVPRPLRTLRAEVPFRIERALVRALAKDPTERFATVSEFVIALDTEAGDAAEASAAGRLIAVLPFVNASSEPDTEYLSDGITDELIDALAKVEGLRVASRTSVFALKGKAQDVRAIGALLDAAWVLEGTVRRAGQRLRISVQLTATNTGRVLWSERFDRTFEDVFEIQEEIATTIVDTLRTLSLVELAQPAMPRRTSSVAAYGLYLKGRYAWNKRTQDGVSEAIRYFEQAIAEDSEYAQAYAGLADSYSLQLDYRNVPVAEGFALAKEYARKALALDDSVAEAHASLGWCLFAYDWDWERSEREFRRAIELDPQYATARQWYAFLLTAQARHEEAIAEAQRAVELDPASVSVRRALGWIYYFARRLDDAHLHLERAIAMNPTSDETYRLLALCETMQERFPEAERSAREAMLFSAEGLYNRATLSYVLARSGQRAAAERELAELEARGEREYVSPVAFATAHLGLENWDAALDWTERAHLERRGWLTYLRVHPIFDALRGRARFEALVTKMKL
ncbi:MAG TPA: protein kinase [Gemmatimonadaceae bacterium]|nr:protein kinase [Gemmatimonadaceae bacterium]